jgi:competence protein ComEA
VRFIVLTKKQTNGLIVLVIISVAIYFTILLYHLLDFSRHSIQYEGRNSGSIAVELITDSGTKGIFFLPERTTISQFLKIAGIKEKMLKNGAFANRYAVNGTAVVVEKEGKIGVHSMDAAKKLLLGIPIDINRASARDLILIPGIGEKLADQIVYLRKRVGKFDKIEQLMEIKGIKDKKLSKLRKYISC